MSATDDKQKTKSTKDETLSKEDFVIINDRYKILPSERLTDLDLPHAKAFLAIDTKRTDINIFAYVCNPELPIREKTINSIRTLKTNGMLPFVEITQTYWPPSKRYCMLVLYERPMGGKIMHSINDTIEPFTDKDIISTFLPLITETLRDLLNRGITHRAIRPDNIFYMDRDKSRIVLGDCITTPAGYDQPEYLETITSGCCMPSGRGNGNLSNDFYSLGASIATLITGSNPVGNYDKLEMLSSKIRQGSFFVLAAHNKLSVAMVELLRGLLTDDDKSRWNCDDIELWLEGRRATPLHGRIEPSAQRSFVFNGADYFTLKELAAAFSDNWFSAASIIKSKQFVIWVKRGLRNEAIAEHLENLIITSEQLRMTDDVFVAKACMLFDHNAPIRYKEISFMPSAFGGAFATAINNREKLNQIIGVLNNELIEYWYENQSVHDSKAARLSADRVRKYLVLRNFLQQKGLGQGIPRCLYELNPYFPCQSDLIKRYFVINPKQLLMAIDKASKKADKTELPIDNHIAAFILTHFKRNVDDQFTALNSTREDIARAGLVSLFALLQWQYGPKRLPNLISWLGRLIKPIIDSYHSRQTRTRIEKSVPTAIRQGSITELYAILDNPSERENDWKDFLRAKREYNKIEHYVERVMHEETGNSHMPHIIGQQVAAIVSGLIFFGGTILLFISKLTEN